MKRRIRYGMVGGGPGSFIGGVHRKAARLDGEIELVCGAFDIDPVKSKGMAKELYLPEDRCYLNYEEMFEKESKLPEGERMDFVSICTPNHVHDSRPQETADDQGFRGTLPPSVGRGHADAERPLR